MTARYNKVNAIPGKEFPEELEKQFEKAVKLEKITILYQVSVVLVMVLTSMTSQSMRVAWMEDAISLLAPVSFLIARRFYERKPDAQFPYGYHRVFSIAFQIGAFALFALGIFLFIESVMTLIKAERPTIGMFYLYGRYWWMGWLMFAALLYSTVPPVILGHKKMSLAEDLHNKLLFTDAETQKANWQTAVAAMIGVTGVGFGIWWTDPVAAIFISISIIYDGYNRLKGAILDLMDEVPTNLKNDKKHPLVKKVHDYLAEQEWLTDFRIRMREAGDVFFTEIFVIPGSMDRLTRRLDEAVAGIKQIDWKLYDVVMMPVDEFSEEQEESE